MLKHYIYITKPHEMIDNLTTNFKNILSKIDIIIVIYGVVVCLNTTSTELVYVDAL